MERKKKRWLLGCVLVVVVIGLAALGAVAWRMWERSKPEPVVEVVTFHPGMPASSIEKTITNRIERWVNQAKGAAKITSRSLAGVSIVRITFRNDIDPNAALTQVNELALATVPTLPPDTLPPIVLPSDPRSSDPVGILGISSAKVDETVLRERADTTVRERLLSVPGAVAPVVLGGKDQSAAPTVRLRIDGHPVVGVPVYLQQGAKRKDISDKIANALPSLQDALPPEVKARWVPFGVDHKWLRENDNGLLTIYVRAPSHSSGEETEKRVSAVEKFLEKNIAANDREAIVSEVGLTPDWSATRSANAGPMDATIRIQLSTARTQSAAAYAAKLRGLLCADMDFADLRFRFASRDMPEPVNIRVRLGTSRDAKEALRFAEDVKKQLGIGIKGVVDCEVVQRLDAPTLTIRADLHKAAALGLSCREVIAQAVAVLKLPAPPDQELFTDLRSGDQSVTLPLQLRPEVDVGALADAKVAGGKAGVPVKLSSLATLQTGTTAVEIDHENLLPVLNVRANIEGRDRGDVIADIRKMLAELQAPQGMRVDLVD